MLPYLTSAARVLLQLPQHEPLPEKSLQQLLAVIYRKADCHQLRVLSSKFDKFVVAMGINLGKSVLEDFQHEEIWVSSSHTFQQLRSSTCGTRQQKHCHMLPDLMSMYLHSPPHGSVIYADCALMPEKGLAISRAVTVTYREELVLLLAVKLTIPCLYTRSGSSSSKQCQLQSKPTCVLFGTGCFPPMRIASCLQVWQHVCR